LRIRLTGFASWGRDLSPALSYAAVGILLFANVINLAAGIAAMDDALGFSPGR
jgi:hypothetical protein